MIVSASHMSLSPTAPQRATVAWIVGGLALCGWLDYVTGYEVSVVVFYLAPIALAAWRLGPLAGCAAGLAAAVIWGVADAEAGHVYSHAWMLYWNAVQRLVIFFCVVLAVHLLGARVRAAASSSSAASQDAAARQPLLVCTQCRKIHLKDGDWADFEIYASQRLGSRVHAKVCPPCARSRYARAEQWNTRS